MRALAMTDLGKPATVVELPAPSIARPDEVLIKVLAATLSRWDLLILAGKMTPHLEHVFPVILGHDFAGIVVETGEQVTRFVPGDAVVGLVEASTLHDGAIAEYVTLDAACHLAHQPRAQQPEQAATLPLAGLAAATAVDAVVPAADKRVLVVGASGGVGGYAVQLAAVRGAHVIATGLPEDESYLQDLGAAEVLDYRSDLATTLTARYPDGIDCLIDTITQDPAGFTALTGHLPTGGRAASTVMIADTVELAARGINATNVMADLAPRGTLDRLVALVDQGTLRAPKLHVVDLPDAPAAIAAMRDSHVQGKFVIRIRDTR
jgi:NADPH2:quinone reductase